MVDFFARCFSALDNKNKVLVKLKVYSIGRAIIRQSSKIVLSLLYKYGANRGYSLKADTRSNKPRNIVTFTSFPARIGSVWLVVETILRQTVKPDKIILWLSKDQFSSLDALPKNLLKLKERGLEIELRDGNLKSHKKYYYTVSEYPNDNLIIIDDDILYRSTMIEDMLRYKEQYPNTIIAQCGLEVTHTHNTVNSFNKWISIYDEEIGNRNFFFGSGGGTYIPAHSLHKDICRKDLFQQLTPLADDIWLNSMARLNKTPVLRTNASSFLELTIDNNETLHALNGGQNMNDVQIQNVTEYYQKQNIIVF